MRGRSILLACTAALALSGCVAAVIPLAAAGAIGTSKGIPARDRTPAPPPSLRVPVFAGESGTQTTILGNSALDATPAKAGPVLAATPLPDPPRATPTFVFPRPKIGARVQSNAAVISPTPAVAQPTPALTTASVAVVQTAVAPPSAIGPAALGTAGGYGNFARYALAHAADIPGEARYSQLIDPDTLTDHPQRLSCGDKPPAVAIDLDPGERTFDPADPPSPVPGLAEALAQLRAAGVVVFWKSSLNVSQADKIYTVLRAVGLDPDRTDRLLLTRKRDERKEMRLLAAAGEWCFIAMAGDRKGDFLEALDYLRDPDGPVAQAFKPRYGDGWFLTPTPIG